MKLVVWKPVLCFNVTLPGDGTVISAIDRRANSTIVSFSDLRSDFKVSNPLFSNASSALNLQKKVFWFVPRGSCLYWAYLRHLCKVWIIQHRTISSSLVRSWINVGTKSRLKKNIALTPFLGRTLFCTRNLGIC